MRIEVFTRKLNIDGGHEPAHASNYRHDIDGLRAIAVLAVIFFHFNLLRLGSGGFVGVDVFFVISGYLITQILAKELRENGVYSVGDFYARRVKRIFPALFSVIIVCLLVTAAKGFPADVDDLSRDIVSVVLFVSNISFFLSSGYFDARMAHNPLLHTWSLAVEEQFYVFLPLILFALRRQAQGVRVWVLGIIALISFAEAVHAVSIDPSGAFYLLPSRAWELTLGALLALDVLPVLSRGWLAELVAVAGVALIAASIRFMTPVTPFPGLAALPSTVGAALIIYSGTAVRTWVARILSSDPLRLVGLISYSLYLWHWPIFVFYTDAFPMPSAKVKFSLIGVCLIVSWLSWKFIERPFRRARRYSVRRSLVVAGTATASLCGIAVGASVVNGAWRSVPHSVQTTLNYMNYDADSVMRAGTCFLIPDHGRNLQFDKGKCLRQREGARNVLLVGDSHAADLWAGFSSAYPNVNFLQATASGCKPVFNATGPKRCTDLMEFVLRDFLPTHRLDMVVLSANWSDRDEAGIMATAEYLGQYANKVVVLGPTPAFDQMLPRLLARSIYLRDETIVGRHQRREPAAIDASLAHDLKQDGIYYISTYRALCNGNCMLWANKGTPMYFDDNHLTSDGAQVLARKVGGQLFESWHAMRPVG